MTDKNYITRYTSNIDFRENNEVNRRKLTLFRRIIDKFFKDMEELFKKEIDIITIEWKRGEKNEQRKMHDSTVL